MGVLFYVVQMKLCDLYNCFFFGFLIQEMTEKCCLSSVQIFALLMYDSCLQAKKELLENKYWVKLGV